MGLSASEPAPSGRTMHLSFGIARHKDPQKGLAGDVVEPQAVGLPTGFKTRGGITGLTSSPDYSRELKGQICISTPRG